MLVEFNRVNAYGRETGAKIAINPLAVGAVHDSNSLSGVSLVRQFDGRGFLVKGSHDEIRAALPGVNLVEFNRVNSNGSTDGRIISINPDAVGGVTDSMHNPGVSVVRLFDGRGYLVYGDYTHVVGQLRGIEPEPADQTENIRLVADHSSDPRQRNIVEDDGDLEDSERD